MKRITFRINRKALLKRILSSNSYAITPEIEGFKLENLIDGNIQEAVKTTWKWKLSRNNVLKYFKKYRKDPCTTSFHHEISVSLHDFLFVGSQMGANFEDISSQMSEIFIKADDDCRDLLLNIPWELTSKSSGKSSHSDLFDQTFASLPLARVIEQKTSKLKLDKKERFHVIYCIYEPKDEPIDAGRFNTSLKRILGEMSGILTFKSVIGMNDSYSPAFSTLIAEIDQVPPHLLIIICHGRTEHGTPQLCFEEWIDVSMISKALERHGKTLGVLLIACDQVFLDNKLAANSGALAFLQCGIPAVIAMQGKVRVESAVRFIRTLLEYFFKNASISRAVAHGREQMVGKGATQECLDWSCPALFLTEDAPEKLSILSDYIENYTLLLRAMQRGISRGAPEYYFTRATLEKKLKTFFENGQIGVRLIFGGLGSGKTSLVRYTCCQAIDKAIEDNHTSFRPILYVDFDRHHTWTDSIKDLLDIFKQNSKEILPDDINSDIFIWPQTINSDSKDGTIEILVRYIEKNRMVLVFDNLSVEQLESLGTFVEVAKTLRKSLLIIVSDIKSTIISSQVAINEAYVVEVKKLDENETQDYVNSHLPNHDAASLYIKTGGILLLLNEIRISPSLAGVVNFTSQQIDLIYKDMLIHRVEKSEICELLNTVCLMALFPNGLNKELADGYVLDWPELKKLRFIDSLLVVEYRYDKSQCWLRLPGFIVQVLQKFYQKEMNDIVKFMADHFIDRMKPDQNADLERNLIELASKQGGVNFLHEIHEIFIKYGYFYEALGMALLLHKWLFRNGRWHDAYKFWERFLEKFGEKSEAHQWIKFAKTAHILGMQTSANSSLNKAIILEPTILDRIDILIQEASLIKDSGSLKKASCIHSNYIEAIDLIENAKVTNNDPDFEEYPEKKALVFYNRAIFRRWWEHDLDGALDDLNNAIKIYDSLGPNLLYMMKVVESELVDMLIDKTKNRKEWETMLAILAKVDRFFMADSNPGDRAICNYRMARCFLHMPTKDEKEREENVICAWEAYETAYQQAKIAGDLRLQLIAQCHLVEVKWRHLNKMEDIEAMNQLDYALGYLREFMDDAWSTRVLRDMLLLQAEVARKLHPPGIAIDILRDAWETALHKTLHPEERADARKAAKILCNYIQELVNSNRLLDIRVDNIGYKELVDKWLGPSNFLINELLEKLKEFYENEGGELNGKSKR